MAENIKEKLAIYKEELEKKMAEYLAEKTNEAEAVAPAAGEMLRYITDMTMRGGKRVRAALLYYSYLAHGGRDKEVAIFASMSVEFAQTFLLIHDDIIDNDDMRRGGETIHKSYEKLASSQYEKADAAHYGRSVAILAGDTACGFSNEVIAELNVDPKNVQRALLELNKMYNQEYYGELLDVNSELSGDLKKEDVLLIHRLKTSPYTFDGPLKIGAILAGASKESVEKLDGYTVPLGVAFQIQDDILGTFGNEEKIGKPVTSDLRQGKKTLLILDALERGTKEQQAVINKNLGNRQAGISELEEVRAVIRETGSLDDSIQLAKRYVAESKKALSALELDQEGKDFLIDIADYMVQREY